MIQITTIDSKAALSAHIMDVAHFPNWSWFKRYAEEHGNDYKRLNEEIDNEIRNIYRAIGRNATYIDDSKKFGYVFDECSYEDVREIYLNKLKETNYDMWAVYNEHLQQIEREKQLYSGQCLRTIDFIDDLAYELLKVTKQVDKKIRYSVSCKLNAKHEKDCEMIEIYKQQNEKDLNEVEELKQTNKHILT